MKFPTLKEVDKADRKQICTWYRFLPSPGESHRGTPEYDKKMEEERSISQRILDRYKELGGMTPELSKQIGFKPPIDS